jgi:chromosome segregation ATPase
MDSILLEMRHLLGSLKRLPPGGFSAWQEQNQATIDRILEIKGISPEVMLSIKTNIEDSKIITQELERASKQVEGKNLGTEELNTYLQQQEKLIEQMRERATRAEERSEMLDQQIRALSEVDQSRKGDSQELDRLRNQNTQLSQERSSLVRHLETLTSEIKRTKLEKEFIEDRLLSMVEETDKPQSVPSPA